MPPPLSARATLQSHPPSTVQPHPPLVPRGPQAHTKRCRKCHAHVEKNGGCNWIACRCGHQFCYFCFGTDHSHHNQPCNAPPTAEAAGAKSDLDYYMHYFDRWHGHCASQQLEGPLRQSARDQTEALMRDPTAPRAVRRGARPNPWRRLATP